MTLDWLRSASSVSCCVATVVGSAFVRWRYPASGSRSPGRRARVREGTIVEGSGISIHWDTSGSTHPPDASTSPRRTRPCGMWDSVAAAAILRALK
jgi:hypothetical protein